MLEGFAERLKHIRRVRSIQENREITQDEMAELIGISRGAYSNYERGTREPDLQGLCMISWALHCSADYLLGITDDPARKDGQLQTDEIKQIAEECMLLSDQSIEKLKDYIELLKLQEQERKKH